jgi:hypothetical protein
MGKNERHAYLKAIRSRYRKSSRHATGHLRDSVEPKDDDGSPIPDVAQNPGFPKLSAGLYTACS